MIYLKLYNGQQFFCMKSQWINMKFTFIILAVLCEDIFGSQVTFTTFDNTDTNSGKVTDKQPKQKKWLVDAIYYDDYQADAPTMMTSPDVCPPVFDVTSDAECGKADCSSDADCQNDFRCCFTGCVFTCVPEVKPAPVVDWLKEPRRSRSGISWLIDGPIKTAGQERCSTTPVGKDEDPLLCPHGYFCHVTDPGNPKKKIPNNGYCVKEGDQQISPGEKQIVLSAALKGRQTCVVDNIVLLDGARIRLENKNCRCRKGHLSCAKNREKSTVDVEIKAKPKKSNQSKSKEKRKRKRKGDKKS